MSNAEGINTKCGCKSQECNLQFILDPMQKVEKNWKISSKEKIMSLKKIALREQRHNYISLFASEWGRHFLVRPEAQSMLGTALPLTS